MMSFRTIKAAVVTLLGSSAAGRYRTIGYDDDATAADYLTGTNRTVQVFFRSGDFPRRGGGLAGPVIHDVTMAVELTVAAASKGDLATLNNEAATAGELAAAIAGFQVASEAADAAVDELAEIVYQILMSAINRDLGHTEPVADRWIGKIIKGSPMPRGEHVIITAVMDLTFRTAEDLTGDAGQTPTPGAAVKAAITVTSDEDGTAQGGAGVQAGG